MPDTYTLIEKVTVGATVSSITFTSIPQTYTDLKIVGSVRTTAGSTYGVVYIYPNGSASSQTARRIYFDYASIGTDNTTTGGLVTGAGGTANTFGRFELDIPNYTNTSYYKSIGSFSAGESNTNTGIYGQLSSNLWSSTSALTSIEIVAAATQYSTFYLYGIAKLGVTPTSAPKATGGDTIVTDGTYWIHTFLSSGTFTPKSNLTCDYLVVAGGGGASYDGGGGAGGFRSTVTATGGGGSLESALSLAANTGYTVTVGAGGAAGAGTSGGQGSDSVFSTITSAGGGKGNYGNPSANGSSGGSGAGGTSVNGTTGTGGAGTANQGYAGGNSGGTVTQQGGGGGGAGAVGGLGNNGNGGAGGTGVSSSITGSAVTRAGGGGGGAQGTAGTGGTGGGGNGESGSSNNATAGTANTGGGGGGGYANQGKAGGSGIVIVRYAV